MSVCVCHCDMWQQLGFFQTSLSSGVFYGGRGKKSSGDIFFSSRGKKSEDAVVENEEDV